MKYTVKYLRISWALARNNPVNLTQLLGCHQMQLLNTEILTACNLWHMWALKFSGPCNQTTRNANFTFQTFNIETGGEALLYCTSHLVLITAISDCVHNPQHASLDVFWM